MNFSAGTINVIATIPYIGFTKIKSIDEPTSKQYTNKWTTCRSELNIYSLSHIPNACAWPSFILSNGYVNAINGAIIVKNAIYITLFKYWNVNVTVNITNATYIMAKLAVPLNVWSNSIELRKLDIKISLFWLSITLFKNIFVSIDDISNINAII